MPKNRLFIEVGGEEVRLKDVCKARGLNYNTIRHRLYRGWTAEEALTIEVGNYREGNVPRKRMFYYKGKERCLREICIMENKPYIRVHQRVVLMGWNIEDAISKPPKHVQGKKSYPKCELTDEYYAYRLGGSRGNKS